MNIVCKYTQTNRLRAIVGLSKILKLIRDACLYIFITLPSLLNTLRQKVIYDR